MKTAAQWLIEKLEEEELIFNHGLVERWKQQALEMENKQIQLIIKSREQTRWAATQIGFLAGFEYALKSSEDYYDKLAKTQLADDDFTKEYLQNECEKICNIKYPF